MVWATTTVGTRNVGTFIGRSRADGNRARCSRRARGQTSPGAATVADRPYFIAYSRLSSPTGALIGMLYVGVPLDAMRPDQP